MYSKTLAIAVASAAAISMSGCSTMSPTSYPGSGTGPTMVDCKTKKDCPVPLYHQFVWVKPDFPDVIYINVQPNETVTIAWTMNSIDATRFNEVGGIEFKDRDGMAAFTCGIDPSDNHVYKCTGKNLANPREYRYGIKTKGLFSGPDVDPVIKNGS